MVDQHFCSETERLREDKEEFYAQVTEIID